MAQPYTARQYSQRYSSLPRQSHPSRPATIRRALFVPSPDLPVLAAAACAPSTTSRTGISPRPLTHNAMLVIMLSFAMAAWLRTVIGRTGAVATRVGSVVRP
jgi:hypothetical protein